MATTTYQMVREATEEVRLMAGNGVTLDAVKSQVFQVLHQRSHDHVRLHQGDYYHDAFWIREHVQVGIPFY